MSDAVVGVILGGVLAICGGVGAQLVAHAYARHREREKIVREKAEAVLMAMYRHRDWLAEKRDAYWFNNTPHDVADPSDGVWALCMLYFPDCSAQLDRWATEISPVLKCIYDEKMEKMKNEEAWIAAGDERLKSFSDLYGVYLEAFKNLQLAVSADIDRQLRLERPLPSQVLDFASKRLSEAAEQALKMLRARIK